ncbi:hypothetical protein QR680_016492 [Steinernema hermaphroditum]|uniref:Skp1-related protein n=1 Tax=Steinernema hermaphroditum TaxID=289476 RepID=A0AA39HDD2_9BILA|nr:hypothetical protein QR680_016492 [Steinernema hermaphroditum]
MQPAVVIESSDGVRIPVTLAAARHSDLLNSMLEQSGGSLEDCIPIPHRHEDLQRVVGWLEQHRNDEPFVRPTRITLVPPKIELDEWEIKFFTMQSNSSAHRDSLFTTARIAVFMGIESLIMRTGLFVAETLKEMKNDDDVRQFLGVPDDLTDDEKKEIELKMAFLDPSVSC